VGSTDDLERRVRQHSEGKVKATKNVRPVSLKAFIEFETLIEARRFEYEIKRRKRKEYVESLIVQHPA
jgi:predicted GIY-YIG superfamily endonuclease